MKKIIVFFLITTLFGCSNTSKSPDMPGTYLMVSQTVNDGTKDTKLTDLKQLKIYTDNFFMYTQVNPQDSVSTFGVGSYTTDKGKVIENVIYSSQDTTVGEPNTYNLEISKTPDGYEQFIPEIVIAGQKNKLTEEYHTVGTTDKTPLDGLWKETKSFNIIKGDTVPNNRTQYKSFYAGYFMFGQTVRDTTEKSHTGIGFGTFKMDSDKQITETDLNSTYAIIAGNTFTVAIEMDGDDKYKQTINNANGSTGVEFYERMKK
ncbi:MAG: hypothetical protein ABI683_07885 [Ginsengibacter sp.]